MKKIISLTLGLVIAISTIAISASCDDTEKLSSEDQAMIYAWNTAIEKDYSLDKLKRFSDDYGKEEIFEDFLIDQFEQLNDEKMLKILATADLNNDKNFNTEKILNYVHNRLKFSEKSLEEKIEYLFYLQDNFYLGDTEYLNFKVSKEEFDTWVESNSKENIFFEKGQGFYANRNDYKHYSLPAVGMYTIRYEDAEFLGDFKYALEYGEYLDSRYQRHEYSAYKMYFKDQAYDGRRPSGTELYIGKYLIFQNDGHLAFFDTSQNKTILQMVKLFIG